MRFTKKKLLLIVFSSWLLQAVEIGLPLKPAKQETSSISSYEKQIQIVQKELKDIAANIDRVNTLLDQINAEKLVIKGKLAQARTEHAKNQIQKQLSDNNQKYQILTDLEQVYAQTKLELEQRLKKLQEYYDDPELTHLKFQKNGLPSFDEVQEISRNLANVRQLVTDLEKRKNLVSEDIAKRKKALDAITNELREKQELCDQPHNNIHTCEVIVPQLRFKKELAEAKVKEAELRLELADAEYFVARKQVNVLRDEYARIKRILTVDVAYVKNAEKQLEKKRQQSVDQQDQLHDQIKFITGIKDNQIQKLKEYRSHYSLTDNDILQLQEWNRSHTTINDWAIAANAGTLLTHSLLLDTQREYLEALIEYEKARLHQEELGLNIIRSWHKMTQRKYRAGSDEAIEQDIRSYITPKTEFQADLAVLTDKRNAAINQLHTLNNLLEKIKNLSADLKNQRYLLFKDSPNEYTETLKSLVNADEQIRGRISLIAKLIETYSNTIATVSLSIKKIEDIVSELSSKGWWQQQSVQAIEWTEIKNFFPDLKLFFADVLTSIGKHISFDYAIRLAKNFIATITNPQHLLHLLLQLIICVVFYFLLILYLPDFRRHLLAFSPEFGALSTVSYFIGSVLGFFSDRLLSIYLWLCLFLFIRFEGISDPFIATLFYLGTIPFLIYYTHSFMRYFIHTNKQRGYVFISQSYVKRFIYVVSFLIISTIIIVFLREAFLQGNYQASQVPVILLAINFIILQVSLLCLISKEQIVSLIPTRTPLWEWIVEQVSRYYYILLAGVIAIIIMSNPYVGYGRQVIYVLSRLFLTLLLIPLFSWLHNRLKRTSSDLFFYYSDSDALKERFSAAKTWYSFFVIFTFLFFILIGVVIGAAIWGKFIGLRELSQWLSYKLYSPGINEVTGKEIEVTAFSLFQILGFIIGGIIVTYIINVFLLRRIFDPLLVGAGVQNTIMTLTRYIIIIVAFLLGLQSAGLDSMATKLAVIFGIIGWAIKEPIGDFFSYFIILVQRPIGIGDLVMIDNETMGVVRQITPRSTILRRRNSVTIIVPNSHVVTKTVTNWNYTRTFFAFEDMLITVPYTADPQKVRALILNVLDSNPNILKNPSPIVWLHDFVDNGFQFLVRGYLTADKTLNQWDISSEIRLEIVRRLREFEIDIASPTRLVRVLDQREKQLQ